LSTLAPEPNCDSFLTGARIRAPRRVRGHDMAGHAIKDAVRAYGARIVDSVYQASVYSVIAYSGLLLLLAIVAMAVVFKMVDVPEFHPK
jgi:hypothetical protein